MSIYKDEPSLPINKKIFITKDEAAELLSMSVSTIERLMDEGRIPYVKFGKLVRFHPPALILWAATLSNEGFKYG